MTASPHQKPALTVLTWELLRLGAAAFGGLGATLALLQHALVERRQWLSQGDVAEALAFTKTLPGSTGIQVVAYLGWRLQGWPGALLAAAAFIAPAMVMMIVVAAGSLALPDAAWVKGALTGIQIAVIGLLAASMWRLAQSEAKTAALKAVLVAGAVLGFFLNAVFVVVGAGLVGAAIDRERGDG
jgi:chromate transporter